MPFRILFRWLANNEQLVSRLAESYPIRRAAQMVVYIFNRSKAITEDSKVAEQIAASKLTDRLKTIRDQLEKKAKE